MYGPQPVGPENLYIVGRYVSGDDIGSNVAYIADLNEQYSMTETMLHKRMEDMELQTKVATPGSELQGVTKREAEIMHWALADVQTTKIERGVPLDTPLCPHTEFKVELPGLALVPDGP